VDNIRGLTVKFDADTSEFKRQLKDFDKNLKVTAKEGKLLADSLKLEWNPEKFKQAQKAAEDAISKTAEKAEVLKQRLAHMEEKGLSTDKQVEEFKKLQNELLYTENSLIKLQKNLEDLDKIKLENLQKQFEKTGKKLTDVGKAMLPISAMAGAMVGGITAATKSAAKFADEISTLATQLDVTADQMQRYQYIGQQLTVSSDQIAKGFVTLRGTIGKALTGETNKATKALEKLGFTLEDLKIKTADEVFEETIARLSTIEDSTVQATAATQIFGEKVATDLTPMLKASSDTMATLNAEYDASGHLTDEQIGKLAALSNAFKKLKTELGNVAKEIGAVFAPTFQRLAEFFEEKLLPKIKKVTDWFENLSDGQKDLILGIGALVTALAPLLLIGGKLVTGVGALLPVLTKLGGAMTGVLGPVGLVIGALALLYATSEDFRKVTDEFIKTVLTSFKPLITTLGDVVTGVVSDLMPLVAILGDALAPVLEAVIPLMGTLGEVMAKVVAANLTTFVGIFKAVAPLLKTVMGLVKPLADMLTFILVPALDLISFALKPVLVILEAIIDSFTWIFKQIGKAGSWLGEKLGISQKDQKAMAGTPQAGETATSTAEKAVTAGATYGDYYSNFTDNSQKSFTVNLTINNYGAELDYDDVVTQINRRLATQY